MASTVWMMNIPTIAEDRWRMMVAAYWLRDQTGFRVMSQEHLEQSTTPTSKQDSTF
jgi:hypothetical protein